MHAPILPLQDTLIPNAVDGEISSEYSSLGYIYREALWCPECDSITSLQNATRYEILSTKYANELTFVWTGTIER